MTHGSLFSGIGGFDYASELMGWENVFHCENNEFGKKVLNYYWPKAKSYDDITKSDFTIHRGRIDILTGGFPCQPYSQAGKRLGKEDDRHLWPEMLRAIREIKPKWVVGENVHGIVTWNDGLVFEEVQVDLENEGYEVQPYILPAVGVNAPHQRIRVWFVAYRGGNGFNGDKESEKGHEHFGGGAAFSESDTHVRTRNVADTNNERLERGENKRGVGKSRSGRKEQFAGCICPYWEKFPTQSPVLCGNDGIPTELDGITISKWRQESIKGYGNAIVPQVALQIFRSIQEYEDLTNK